ncbi:DNA-binding protein [Rhodococcus sp. MEB064]|uniref:DNA-binding protein n=1 Tax=Rhodococcus sp. MEB064 TaxID=1587522 RepID=UPI0005B6F795|nr:DNA-binding protein [Rhodococcus sp. MEB064]KIQ15362.1 integrase [Rhodococcus sp. MEB064]
MTKQSQMTLQELLALPVAVDLVTASRALGIARTTGYELAQRNQYPVRLIRAGQRYTVPTIELLRVLGVDHEYVKAALG